MTDLDTLLRAMDTLRSEVFANAQAMRAETTTAMARMVERGEHAAQMGALEHRVAELESSRVRALTALVYPLLVGLLLAAVGYLIAKGGR